MKILFSKKQIFIRIFSGICLALLVGICIEQISFDLEKISAGVNGAYAEEYVAALNWLRSHSQPGDVVLTEWTQGHQVVNIAGRPVVATSKVYPSEAAETAQRYRDLARFFTASSEEAALKIASKYQVRYVFLRKKFDWDSTLKDTEGSTQKIIIDGRLTRYGLNHALIGMMFQGREWNDFKPVFESKNFLIYKIAAEVGRLSFADKEFALRLARLAVSRFLRSGEKIKTDTLGVPRALLEKKRVDVTIWQSGELRGSQVVLGENIAESVVEAAVRSSHDPRFKKLSAAELDSSTFEIFIFGDNVPLPKPFLNNDEFLGDRGFFLKNKNNAGYYLPAVLIQNRYDMNDFLGSLCGKAGLPFRCWQEQDAQIYYFDVEDFIESGKNGFFDLAKNTPIDRGGSASEALPESLVAAADWLVKMQLPDGRFQVYFRPFEKNAAGDDLLRNAAADWSLFTAYKKFGQKKFSDAALRNLDYLRRNSLFYSKNGKIEIKKTETQLAGFLNFSLLSLLEAHALFLDPSYLEEAKKIGDFLIELQKPDGSFRFRYGGNFVIQKNDVIYDGQAAVALSKLGRSSGDNRYLESARRAFSFLESDFREKRRFEEELSIAVYAWLVNVSRGLYDATGDKEYAKFGVEVADWLMDYQRWYGPAVEIGAYQNTTKSSYVYSAGTAKVAEAQVDAYYLAKKLGLPAAEYLQSLENSLHWLRQMQYDRRTAYRMSPEIYDRLRGGFKTDYLNPDARIDYASHFLMAGIGFLNITDQL